MTDSAPPPTARPPDVPAPAASRGKGCAPWLIGCAVVLIVVLLIGGALTWWFVGRPIAQIARAAQDVARVQQIDARVTNRATFDEPASGALTEAQVERYVAVLGRMNGDLEREARILEERYEELDGRRPQWTDVPRLAGAYADFLRLLVRAKEVQVEALNAERFSLEEYAWVRREVLRAAGLPGSGYDLGAFVDGVTGGDAVTTSVAPAQAPPANVALVERHRERLDELAFLAVLGL
ncbi:hypothetical protein BH23DEI1_BH23DEI1_13060 [soil metagenome]